MRGVDEREWDDLARRDALWAVLSHEAPGSWTEEAFFASGEEEVAGILAGLEAQGLMPGTGRALDFGCGAGRLTRALASRFDEAVGVDVSAEMVARARELTPGCRFERADDLSRFDDGSFDLVLSLIALQHVSSRDAIRAYIADFARVAAPGGVVVFQLPTGVDARVRLHPLRVANRAVRRLPWSPAWVRRRLMPHSMSLTALPQAEVQRILESADAHVVTAFPDDRTGSAAVPSLVYVARR